MAIYPLPMRFPVPIDGSAGKRARAEARTLRVGEHIDVTITPAGWSFIKQTDRLTFEGLPVGDRMEYRRQFEAQVTLAKETPR
jgi:hypothetical protein